jgi:hypothetical protein
MIVRHLRRSEFPVRRSASVIAALRALVLFGILAPSAAFA